MISNSLIYDYPSLYDDIMWWKNDDISFWKALIDKKKSRVEGEITIKLYKGNLSIVKRKSQKSIYSMEKSSFEGGKIFSKKYVENFIKKAARQQNQ